MSLNIPEGWGQVTWHFTGAGLNYPAACTMGFANPTDIDVADLAEQFYNQFESSVLTELNGAVDLVGTSVKLGPNEDGPIGSYAEIQNGDEAGSGASSQVAYLVTKTTALGGRRNRGRMYLPGVTEAVIGSDGALDSGFFSALQTDLDTLYAAAFSADTPFVLLHSGSVGPTVLTGLVLSPVAATQRRRLRR